MKTSAITFTALLAVLTIPIISAHTAGEHTHNSAIKPIEVTGLLGQANFQYRVDPTWGQLDKQQYKIKNCHAIAQLKDKSFLALCDDNKHNFLHYSLDGKLKKSWMTEYPGAHGIEVFDDNGKESMIIVDCGWAVREGKQYRESGRVVKTNLQGQVIFSIGHPQTIGQYTPGQTFMPCDAAVAPNGDIYVADGYGSQWLLQYDKNGKFIRKFGGPTDPNKEARLQNAHGVSIDLRDPSQPKLMVSSRVQNQIKFFTLDGKHLYNIDIPGAFGGQAVQQGENLYIGVCWSKENGTGKKLPNSGFVLVLDKDNKVVSSLGGSAPVYKDGKLQPLSNGENPFYHVHDLCVDTDGSIYVVQWNSKGAYPIKLERVKK